MRGALKFMCGNQFTECPSWFAEGVYNPETKLVVVCDNRDCDCPSCKYDDNAWSYSGSLGDQNNVDMAPGKPYIIEKVLNK
jgi:hypothetical protein